jgi:enamine deaminase RidA (YjgF/YER057c/UK114 family)
MGASAVRMAIGVVCLSAALSGAKKKNPDDITQTLELPKDPPAVSVGETKRLIFSVSPLSGKGLLSQQTRDAIKTILKENGNIPAVHIRAFVAGSGDVRRVPQIVSEVFTEKKLPLPSVSVLRVGGLPLDNAQVVLEVVSVAKKEVSPAGLRFLSGELVTGGDGATSPRPLLDNALGSLATKAAGSQALQVTCYVSQLNQASELNGAITARFPGAAVDLVQSQRAPWRAFANCEAVVRGGDGPARIAFTGTRVAFGAAEKDATLAFQRLDRDLADAGATPADILQTNVYPLSQDIETIVRRVRPVGAPVNNIVFEGLASMDAGFAVDAIAGITR